MPVSKTQGRKRFFLPHKFGIGLAFMLFAQTAQGVEKCFEITDRNHNESETFYVITEDPEVIQLVTAELKVEDQSKRKLVKGPLAAGNGGFNGKWTWHFVPGKWTLTDMGFELCDNTPSGVEAHRDDWLKQPNTFCPWKSHVHRECQTTAISPQKAGEALGMEPKPRFWVGSFLIEGVWISPSGRTDTSPR